MRGKMLAVLVAALLLCSVSASAVELQGEHRLLVDADGWHAGEAVYLSSPPWRVELAYTLERDTCRFVSEVDTSVWREVRGFDVGLGVVWSSTEWDGEDEWEGWAMVAYPW